MDSVTSSVYITRTSPLPIVTLLTRTPDSPTPRALTLKAGASQLLHSGFGTSKLSRIKVGVGLSGERRVDLKRKYVDSAE